ncbi:AzlD domain-containing protein [Sutcliffiella cohnii]|uniref:Branched-chain amino acid transporter n=1 Tax=Sutcliffiella cohnii TaxID=33932 RepID=A0A223KM03_9BACI|nr:MULTISPECIES: AzlD domain-containing protein [Sutcliffiella]AST90515.1 branched-chain amino acid transporter [Sutcliffiella cohnii]MED4016795.1 AzlD domain-containing protein [Sutcliffiella cohnii]WBL16167.1 AzlD domain-containing protein [Sutcliffiella sp. NC1]
MNSMIVMMIIGMAVVTYLPRLLPFIMFQGKELPPFLQGVLKNVPFAILGALIIPGVFTINPDIWYGIVGVFAAFIVAYFGANIIIVVLSSIAIVSLYALLVAG